MGKIHEKLYPWYAKVLRNYQKPKSALGGFLAGPWPSMAINRGRAGGPVQCKGHKDMKDEVFSMTALFVFGSFSGGDEILCDANARVQLKSGDGFLFPGRIMAHGNDDAIGNCCSLVAYAPQETMSYNQHPNSKENQERRHKKLGKKRAEYKAQKFGVSGKQSFQ